MYSTYLPNQTFDAFRVSVLCDKTKILKKLPLLEMSRTFVLRNTNAVKLLRYRWKIFFYPWFHLYGYLPIHIPHLFPFFPPSLPYTLSLPSLPPKLAAMRMWPQPFSHMLYRICTRAQANCEKPVPIQWESVPSLPVSKKWPSAQRFDVQAARPAVTHPSTDPIKSCLT